MRLEYFEMIDRVAAFEPDRRRIVCESRVPDESPVFEGHFPGHPLMPGVLLTETMAQTSGWLIIGLGAFSKMPFLAGVKSAKFRTFVTPGQPMSIEATLLHDGSGFAVTKAKITVEGKTAADAELTFRVTDFPSPDFAESMRAWSRRISFPQGALGDGA